MENDSAVTIGCDLGDRRSELCELARSGRVARRATVSTTRAGFTEYFAGRPPSVVVMEAGTHSRWASAQLTQLGHRVVVANPRRVALISGSDSKNDRKDAEMLARLGRADETLLSPVQHRGMKVQSSLAVLKARDALVASRTQLVNHIRGTLKAAGYRAPSCTAESFHRKARASVPPEWEMALAPVFEVLERVTDSIRQLEKKMDVLAERFPDVKLVEQVNGVGRMSALAFILTLEDKERFKKSRDVGAYLGLRPKQDQSGSTDKQLRITKAGDPYLRRLLVCCANYILGPFAPDSDLRRWGLELARRGGKNAKKRATVAVARKLAVLLHRLWVTGEEYEPLRNSRIQEQRQAS
jgi:transposase